MINTIAIVITTGAAFFLGCCAIALSIKTLNKTLSDTCNCYKHVLEVKGNTEEDIIDEDEERLEAEIMLDSYFTDTLNIMWSSGIDIPQFFTPGYIHEEGYAAAVVEMAKNTKKLANPSIKHSPPAVAEFLVNQLFTILQLAAYANIPLDELWENHIQYWSVVNPNTAAPVPEMIQEQYAKNALDILTKYGWKPGEH